MSKANVPTPPTPPTRPAHPDPLVDEIRAIKQRISAAAGHDVRTLCTQLEKEQASQHRPLADRRAVHKAAAGA